MGEGIPIKDTIELLSWLKKHWEKRSTLLLVLIVILFAGLYLASQFDIEKASKAITAKAAAVIWLAMISVSLLWYFSRKLPKTTPGKIGIAIAIDCETTKEKQRLKADFVRALTDEIAKGNHQHFHVFELSEYHASKINNENVKQYQKKIRAHLLIHGQCRIRQHQKQPTYVLKLDASVLHLGIPIEVSQQLGQDMRIAFPAQMLIPESEEVLGFQFTKDLVRHAARFSLGAASLLSHDAVTAFDLHHGLWLETKKLIEDEVPLAEPFKLFKNRLPIALVQEGLHSARFYYVTKPAGYLDKIKSYLDVIQEIDPRNYDAHLVRGIYYFLHDHDTDKAKKEIRKAKNDRNSAWQYSAAFLAAYEGDLEEAHKIYRRAFRGEVTVDTPLDVEIFIRDVLDSDPDRIQLWYCLGMINYFDKGDLASARRDFEKFIDLAGNSGKFPTSVGFAKKYLSEIDSKKT